MTDVIAPDLPTESAAAPAAVRRLNIKTVPADEVMAGGWIKLRAMKVAESTTFKQLLRLTQHLVASGKATPEDLEKNEQTLRAFICSLILDWNWVDDDGHPLPSPHNNPDVYELLTDDEGAFLFEAVMSGGKKNATLSLK
jgi:hypothetical protein